MDVGVKWDFSALALEWNSPEEYVCAPMFAWRERSEEEERGKDVRPLRQCIYSGKLKGGIENQPLPAFNNKDSLRITFKAN